MKIPTLTKILTLAVLAAGSFLQGAAAQDLAGAKDHPLLKRYKDSIIFQYSQEAYKEYPLALGKALNPAAPASEGRRIEKEEMLEGQVTRISYLAPAGRSSLEVFRNYQKELTDKGFEILFRGEGEDLGFMFCSRYAGLYSQIFEYNQEGNRYLAARLSRPEGDVTVAVFVCDYTMGLAGDLQPAKGQPLVQVDVIEDKPMEERMVVVSAEKMASSIETTGRIALYGIFFDFDKAVIKAESRPTLDQMGKLLTSIPDLKLLVVGHTDNVGGFDYNQKLSQARAAAVVKDLVENYGVNPSRLTPHGAAYVAPIASNRTEEGRAKNRRVELVEQ